MSRTDRAPSPQAPITPRRIRSAALGLALALALLASVAATPASLAMGSGPCTMEILVDGRPVPEYIARGGNYVEALAGREYSVRLTNRSDRRIAVALTVDGLNSIDAKTTSANDATKWIIGPYESITLDGWQTSSQTARRFFFTTESRSYGSWLGKTRNLGVIAAAVFREKVPQPRPLCGDRLPCPYGRFDQQEGKGGGADRRERAQSQNEAPAERRAQSSDAPAPQAGAPSSMAEEEADTRDQLKSLGDLDSRESGELRKDEGKKRSDDLAATGIGRELGHHVIRVPFDAEDHAATIMEVRYEYREALVKLGVLPRCIDPDCDGRLSRREAAHGFTNEGYAPDPYRRNRR